MKYLVMIGNVVDGMEFYGPFNTHDDALDYAENQCSNEWYIADLNEAED